MRTCKVSDELYEQLKNFVVDPFDDTPEAVIGRLIEIVNKAKNRWSPFEEEVPSDQDQDQRERQPMFQPRQSREEDEVVVL